MAGQSIRDEGMRRRRRKDNRSVRIRRGEGGEGGVGRGGELTGVGIRRRDKREVSKRNRRRRRREREEETGADSAVCVWVGGYIGMQLEHDTLVFMMRSSRHSVEEHPRLTVKMLFNLVNTTRPEVALCSSHSNTIASRFLIIRLC